MSWNHARQFNLGLLLILLGAVVQPTVGDIIDTLAGTGIAGYTGDGGSAIFADLNQPYGVAVASNGDVYFADNLNLVVRKVDSVTGNISTYAGGGSPQTGDGTLATTAAWVNTPNDVVVDSAGNVYIADTNNHRIRKVTAATGIISTIAGTGVAGYSGDGAAATAAQINTPRGIAVDSAGNVIFSDSINHRIRMITPGGTISTIAGTGTGGFNFEGWSATAAAIQQPHAVAIDGADTVYFADTLNNRIRKFTVGGDMFTVAGTGLQGFLGDGGPASAAELNWPGGLGVKDNGPTDGTFGFTTVFGSSQGTIPEEKTATQVTLAVDHTINSITAYVLGPQNPVRYAIYTDSGGEPAALLAQTASVEKPGGGMWFTISLPETTLTAGTYWLAVALSANSQKYKYVTTGGQTRHSIQEAIGGYSDPWGTTTITNTRRISIYANWTVNANEVWVADTQNNRIRQFTEFGTIDTVAGTGVAGYSGDGGPATAAQVNNPEHVAVNAAGDVFIGDTLNLRVRKIDATTSNISTYGGTGAAGYSGEGGPATSALVNEPRGLYVDSAGDLFLADSLNHVIRKITAATGVITLVAGTPGDDGSFGDTGDATLAVLGTVEDVTLDGNGNLYIADTGQARIRKVVAATGIITTIMGTGDVFAPSDPLADVKLVMPAGVAVDDDGNVYAVDRHETNARVVKYTVATSTYATIAGTGTTGYGGDGGPATAATINKSEGVEVDSAGNVYIADTFNSVIRKVDVATGIIDTVAGNGTGGYSGDGGPATAAELDGPGDVAVDKSGNVYIADTVNSVIRKVDVATGLIETIVGTGTAGFSGDGGDATLAEIDAPSGLGFTRSGSSYLYIGDTNNHRVRFIDRLIGSSKTIISWREIEPQ